MDNDMIVDFINKVEPDFSYGTSDGMTRAMVESAENLASVNEYITESMYEVYNETLLDQYGKTITIDADYKASDAEDNSSSDDDEPNKPGFFGKLSNKIDTYFQLFMRLVKKFITKIKGFFMTVKRKLTVAFTKAIKAVANFLRNRINNNKKKFDATDKEGIEIYHWNDQVLASMSSGAYFKKKLASGLVLGSISITNSSGNKYDLDAAKDAYAEIKEWIDDIAVAPDDDKKSGESLLSKTKEHFDPNNPDKFLQKEFKVNIDGKINLVYNNIMKTTSDTLKNLKKEEKDIRKQFKKSSNKDDETRRNIKNSFKGINYVINQTSLIKYRVAQKIASACFKYYKKLFTAVRKVFGGFNIFGTSGDYKEKKKSSNESVTIL